MTGSKQWAEMVAHLTKYPDCERISIGVRAHASKWDATALAVRLLELAGPEHAVRVASKESKQVWVVTIRKED